MNNILKAVTTEIDRMTQMSKSIFIKHNTRQDLRKIA